MFQEQIEEIPLLSPGKLGLFYFSLIFAPIPPNIGHSHQLKTTFSSKYGTGLSSQKVSS